MEWVEFTARTLEEAKDLALDRLGVAADDAEFEVLAEPKPGLFGRLRGEARVRARVRPAQARQKVDRRERRPRKSAAAASDGSESTAKAVRAPSKAATKDPAKERVHAAPKPPAKPRPQSEATDAEPMTSQRTQEHNDVSA
jgi:spoIIIJ-associated protein